MCLHRAALLSAVLDDGFISVEPIEKGSIVQTGEVTLYEPENEETDEEGGSKLVIGDLTYKFCNSARDLYPFTKNPEIPLERFEMIFGKNQKARSLYNAYGKWGGSCFGIAASSGMFQHEDNDVSLQDYREGAACPRDLSLSDLHRDLSITLHTFIEAAHIIQFDDMCLYQENRVSRMPLSEKLQLLCDRVDAFGKTGNDPVLMDVFGGSGGHAVLPYRLEHIDQYKSRLHIYDSNWPNEVRFCDLTKDGSGNYIGWRFPMFSTLVYSSDSGNRITFTSNEDIQAAWENRPADQSGGRAIISTPGNNVAIRNEDGIIIKIENGDVTILNDSVIPIYPKYGVAQENPTHSFYLAPGVYQVEILDNEEEISLRFSETEHAIEVVTDASTITIQVCDGENVAAAVINEPEKRFFISLFDAQKEVAIQGISSEQNMRVSLIKSELKLLGIDAEKVFSLRINNKDAAVRNFITQEESGTEHNEETENRILEMNKKKVDDPSDQ